MHLFKALLAGAALVASTLAQGPLAFTSFPSNVQVGKPVTVTWAGGDATLPVTIKLRKGPSDDLKDVAVLTSTATGGSYIWTPSSSLVDGPDYALQIEQGSVINYTNLFAITGGYGTAVPTSESSTTTSIAATSSTALSSALSSSSSIVPSTTIRMTTGVSSSHFSRGTGTTIARNTTLSTPGLTSTRGATLTPTVSPTGPETSLPTDIPNAASAILSSPAALILGAFAAFAYLN